MSPRTFFRSQATTGVGSDKLPQDILSPGARPLTGYPREKKARRKPPGLKVSPLGGNYYALWTESGAEALTPLAAISLLRSMCARRIGLITNTASRAAIELQATATMNTDCQPKFLASTLPKGTSRAAVPLAVYSMPLMVVAYFAPKVS